MAGNKSAQEVKRAINELGSNDFRFKKPCVIGYDLAIIIVAAFFIAACVAAFGACDRDFYSWGSIMLSTVVVIVLAVMMFYLVNAVITARKEKMTFYRESEKKRTDVYGKVMDAWLLGEQLLIKQEYDFIEKSKDAETSPCQEILEQLQRIEKRLNDIEELLHVDEKQKPDDGR